MDYTAEQLIGRYITLRDKLRQLNAEHEERTREIKAHLQALEGGLSLVLNAQKAQNIKTEHGTAFKVQSMSVQTVDKGALFTYVEQSGDFDILTAAVSPDGVRAFMEQYNCPPPGVNVSFITKINVRRK